MLVVLLQLQLVQFGFSLSPHDTFAWTDNIKDNHLVPTLLEPAAGHIKRLLRTNRPDASHRMAVHPNLSFAPLLEVEERVAHLLQIKVTAIVAATEDEVICFLGEPETTADDWLVKRFVSGRLFSFQLSILRLESLYCHFVIVRNTNALPLIGRISDFRFIYTAKMRTD